MSHTLELPGLHEDNPRDFLAALGLLKLFAIRWPEYRPRLAWIQNGALPTIHTSSELPTDWSAKLANELQTLADHPAQPIRHHKIIRTTSSEFRHAARRSVCFGDSDHPLAALPGQLYAAYSSQLTDENSDQVIPTAFSFGNGQSGKNLLLDIHQLITALNPDEFITAVSGRAKPVPAKTLRWNPSEFRPAAFRGPNPGVKIKGDDILDVPAFNVLAFFGLTFFPCVATSHGDRTLGFISGRNGLRFAWPIWESPLDSLEILGLVGQKTDAMTSRPGVIRTWQSRRFSSDKSLYFTPAEPVF